MARVLVNAYSAIIVIVPNIGNSAYRSYENVLMQRQICTTALLTILLHYMRAIFLHICLNVPLAFLYLKARLPEGQGDAHAMWQGLCFSAEYIWGKQGIHPNMFISEQMMIISTYLSMQNANGAIKDF